MTKFTSLTFIAMFAMMAISTVHGGVVNNPQKEQDVQRSQDTAEAQTKESISDPLHEEYNVKSVDDVDTAQENLSEHASDGLDNTDKVAEQTVDGERLDQVTEKDEVIEKGIDKADEVVGEAGETTDNVDQVEERVTDTSDESDQVEEAIADTASKAEDQVTGPGSGAARYVDERTKTAGQAADNLDKVTETADKPAGKSDQIIAEAPSDNADQITEATDKTEESKAE